MNAQRINGLCALLAMSITAAAAMVFNPGVLQGDLLNPDSALRLVRLEAILHAGAPLHAVARDGSGAGTVLHWSHLMDSLLLLISAPAAAVVGWHEALAMVALLFGPASMAALGAAVGWAAAPWTAPAWRWTAAVSVCLCLPIVGYGVPGVVHHHVLLVVVAVMAAGWAARMVHAGHGGWALGGWAAAGVWLSPEAMPLCLMALCYAWLGWLIRPSLRLASGLAQAGGAFFLAVTAAWLADPPMAGIWVPEVDRISIVFVTLAAAVAACGALARAGLPRIVVAGAGSVLALAWLGLFPALLGGAEGLMSPAEARSFFEDITEMMPIDTLGEAVGFLSLGAIATIVLATGALRRRSVLLAYGAACGALLILGGAQHVRFAAYAGAFAAVLLPVALSRLGRPSMRAAVLALAFMLPQPGNLIVSADAAPAPAHTCALDGVAALLSPYAGRVVLSGASETPELLWRTEVLTVGSHYHRNPQALMRLKAAWGGPAGDVMPPAVQATGAHLLLVCPRPPTPSAGPTLLAALQAGTPPPWLHRIGQAGKHGYVLYGADLP